MPLSDHDVDRLLLAAKQRSHQRRMRRRGLVAAGAAVAVVAVALPAMALISKPANEKTVMVNQPPPSTSLVPATTTPTTVAGKPTTTVARRTTVPPTTIPTSALPGLAACGQDPTHVGARVRPDVIVFGCATSADYVENIKWTTWSPTGAMGTGVHAVNNCQPDCASGTYARFPVKVVLSNPGPFKSYTAEPYYPAAGTIVFRTITVTPTSASGRPESDTWTTFGSTWGWP